MRAPLIPAGWLKAVNEHAPVELSRAFLCQLCGISTAAHDSP